MLSEKVNEECTNVSIASVIPPFGDSHDGVIGFPALVKGGVVEVTHILRRPDCADNGIASPFSPLEC